MTLGIRLVQCSSCGNTREVETGIKATYCCNHKMEEAKESEGQIGTNQEEQEDLHIRPGLRLMQCSACGSRIKVEAGIKAIYCCNRLMEEAEESEEQAEKPQQVHVRLIDS